MRGTSVRFSIILKQTCCWTPRVPLPAIREHQVTPRWLHIYARGKTHQRTMDKSHMMVGKSCIFLTRTHSFVSSRGVRGSAVSTITANQVRPWWAQSGGNSGGGIAWKWEIATGKQNKKKKGDMNKREGVGGDHAVKIDGMVIASCLLMAGLQVCQWTTCS